MPAREAEPPVALDWPICAREACIGVQLEGQECCLAHVDDTSRASFLDGLKPEGVVDLRGTSISSELLSEVLAALTLDETPVVGTARFGVAQSGGSGVSPTRAEGVVVPKF